MLVFSHPSYQRYDYAFHQSQPMYLCKHHSFAIRGNTALKQLQTHLLENRHGIYEHQQSAILGPFIIQRCFTVFTCSSEFPINSSENIWYSEWKSTNETVYILSIHAVSGVFQDSFCIPDLCFKWHCLGDDEAIFRHISSCQHRPSL